MMETILDGFAQTNALRSVDARLKLALGVGAILISVSSLTPYAPVFIAVSMAFTTLFLARIPVKVYIQLLTIPLFFSLFSGVVILFLTGGGMPVWNLTVYSVSLSATSESVALALLVTSRTLAGMCALFFIALTTPMIEIFSILRSLRLPKEFVDLAMLVYRFIFLLIGEAIAIHNAQVMRHGYTTYRSQLRSFSMLGAMLFLRSWERGEELMVAMDARCYDGKFSMLEGGQTLTARGTTAVAIYLVFCTVITVIPGVLMLQ